LTLIQKKLDEKCLELIKAYLPPELKKQKLNFFQSSKGDYINCEYYRSGLSIDIQDYTLEDALQTILSTCTGDLWERLELSPFTEFSTLSIKNKEPQKLYSRMVQFLLGTMLTDKASELNFQNISSTMPLAVKRSFMRLPEWQARARLRGEFIPLDKGVDKPTMVPSLSIPTTFPAATIEPTIIHPVQLEQPSQPTNTLNSYPLSMAQASCLYLLGVQVHGSNLFQLGGYQDAHAIGTLLNAIGLQNVNVSSTQNPEGFSLDMTAEQSTMLQNVLQGNNRENNVPLDLTSEKCFSYDEARVLCQKASAYDDTFDLGYNDPHILDQTIGQI